MRFLPLALLVAACGGSAPPPPVAPAPPPPPPTIHRSIVQSGQRVGSSVWSFAADGTASNAFDIHDNGRGPHADAKLRFRPDGTLAELEATGHTVYGAP